MPVRAIPNTPGPVTVSDGFAVPVSVIGWEPPLTVGFHRPDCAGAG